MLFLKLKIKLVLLNSLGIQIIQAILPLYEKAQNIFVETDARN